jgi:GNAT superfamily N-acetyltransferase
MPVLVKIAATSAELDALFRGRHATYVEKGGYMPATHDKRIYDRFDAFPSTVNFVAYADGKLVGGVRVMRDDGAGTHADDYFDFGPYLPARAVVGSGSQLWVDPAFRGRGHVVPMLMNLSFYYLAAQGVTHMVATVNPEVEDRFFACGYEPLGPVLHNQEKGVPFRPCMLEISSLASPIRSFIERQDAAHLMRTFNRVILAPGEALFEAGQRSDAAYIVVEGTVSAVASDGSQVQTLGPGELVGELGVMLDRPRSAAVVAGEGATLLHIPRDAFLDALRSRDDVSLAVLRSTATRLWQATSRVA